MRKLHRIINNYGATMALVSFTGIIVWYTVSGNSVGRVCIPNASYEGRFSHKWPVHSGDVEYTHARRK